MKVLSRILFAISALILAFGAYVHTSAFGKVSAAVAKSDLPEFFGKGFKVLWLQDSVLQIIFAIIFTVLAIRPMAVPKWVVIMLALLLLGTVAFVYSIIGNFIAGHLFLVAAAAAILGALLKQ
ncbi:MAG TPA: hypothetical protein VJ281_09460 [Chthoniobacterales bacterium]|jgi:hypothetical protein|nr:hypothetical protein [Chthoniobacterales bacterium]